MIPFFIRMMDPAEEEKSIHSQPEGAFRLSCNPYDPRATFSDESYADNSTTWRKRLSTADSELFRQFIDWTF